MGLTVYEVELSMKVVVVPSFFRYTVQRVTMDVKDKSTLSIVLNCLQHSLVCRYGLKSHSLFTLTRFSFYLYKHLSLMV